MDLNFVINIGTLLVLAVTAVILWYTAKETKSSGIALEGANSSAQRTAKALDKANAVAEREK